LTEPNERYKRPPSRRKKTAPVKRIVLSPEATRAHEEAAEKRAERHRDYGRHLASDNKPR
jgi:hypothetical protein